MYVPEMESAVKEFILHFPVDADWIVRSPYDVDDWSGPHNAYLVFSSDGVARCVSSPSSGDTVLLEASHPVVDNYLSTCPDTSQFNAWVYDKVVDALRANGF